MAEIAFFYEYQKMKNLSWSSSKWPDLSKGLIRQT